MVRTKVAGVPQPKRRREDGASSSSSQPRTNQPLQPLYTHDYHYVVKDDNEALIHARLHDKPLWVTKFVDKNTLRVLGLKGGVKYLLEKGGIYKFAKKAALTYPALTLEFLISMRRTPSEEGLTSSSITCRLFNRVYTFTYEEIAEAFGWPNDEPTLNPPSDQELCFHFWPIIAKPWDSRANRVNHIEHPCLRYVCNLLNNTILINKGDQIRVNQGDLKYLWALTPQGVGSPNWVDVFIRGVEAIQQRGPEKILCGGMVTLLALYKRVPFPRHCQPLTTSSSYLDRPSLLAFRSITYEGSDCYHKYGENRIRLPQTTRFLITASTRGTDFSASQFTRGRHPIDEIVDMEHAPDYSSTEEQEEDEDEDEDEDEESGDDEQGDDGDDEDDADEERVDDEREGGGDMEEDEHDADRSGPGVGGWQTQMAQMQGQIDEIRGFQQRFTSYHAGSMFDLQNQMRSLFLGQTAPMPPGERERLEAEERQRAEQFRASYIAQQHQYFWPGQDPPPPPPPGPSWY